MPESRRILNFICVGLSSGYYKVEAENSFSCKIKSDAQTHTDYPDICIFHDYVISM